MGLSRVVHPLPAMTLQAKQMLVQDNQIHSNGSQTDLQSTRVLGRPGERVSARTEGRAYGAAGAPQSPPPESVLCSADEALGYFST